MPELTRRRYREECWHIYYGDVRIGTIAVRASIPPDEDPWGWIGGFYPGSHPGEHEDGATSTFDQARGDFEDAWRRFLSKRTEADFQAGAIKRPGPSANMPCGKEASGCRRETFDSHRLEQTTIHVPHISAAERALAGVLRGTIRQPEA
jgi:hypothetical protein